jgi:hypothetical protein
LAFAGTAVSSVVLAFACNAPLMSGPLGDSEKNGATSKNATDPGGGSTAAGGTSTAGLPCAVGDVFAKECRTCHDTQPKAGASTSLVTYGDLTKDFNGKKVYELVSERIHADTGRMPPAARLSDDEVKAIDDWVSGGAPQASEQCGAAPTVPPSSQPLDCPAPATMKTLKAAAPFTWDDPNATDQYECFGVDETETTKRQVIAFGPMIQNPNIVHHILVFQSPDSMSNQPTKCDAATSGAWKLVTGWAPGGGNFVLPPEAGMPLDGTVHWVLQVHYNNARALQGQSDSSGFQVCETDQLRPNNAAILAFGSMDFTIPPRTSSFKVTCDYALDQRYQGVTFFGAVAHMHKLGKSLSTHRLPGGNGAEEVVFDQAPFNFEQQANSPIHKTVAPGDVMRTRCEWANTTDKAVSFGENTGDEMCFNFLAYYPAIPDDSIGGILPTQTWVTPSLSLPLIGGPDCTSQ